MITLYGSAQGRASRSLIALEEFGFAYEHVPLRPWANAEDREALIRLNPNARAPVLKDGDLVLWESMAINLHLAHRAGRLPKDSAQLGRVFQWSFWAQTEIDVPARHRARGSPDTAVRTKAQEAGPISWETTSAPPTSTSLRP
jgi:glutathione S-transferase